MTDFLKYPSLVNHYNAKLINPILVDHGTAMAVATEKLHGANFSFHCDGTLVTIARRTDFIHEGENFFDCWTVKAKYESRVFDLWNKVKQSTGHSNFTIILFGEIYGTGVNKGIDYIDEGKDFRAFDLFVADHKINNAVWSTWSYMENVVELLIPIVPVIARGKLKDLIKINPEFLTTLNPIEGNFAEGFVVKPEENRVNGFGERVGIKVKGEKWVEKSRTPKPPRIQNVLSPEEQKLFNEMGKYITTQRVENVLSKMTEEEAKKVGNVIKETAADVLAEFSRDEYVPVKPELQAIGKEINKAVASVVRNVLFEIPLT